MPSPPSNPTYNVGRLYPEFSSLAGHCIGLEERELQGIFLNRPKDSTVL